MRRREVLLVLTTGMIGAQPLRAQQRAIPVIGQLSVFSAPANPGDLLRGPLHQGMSEMGFVEGQNMITEYRWAEGDYRRLPALAADLVSRKVDVIVTIAGNPPALAAKNATSTIPIVFISVGDPVGNGLVVSLARPGGNLTGFSNLSIELTPKRLELLCELVPEATVIALLVNPYSEVTERYIRLMQDAAGAKRIQLPILKAGTEGELDTAFASLSQLQAGGLVIAADGFFNSRCKQLAALALRYAVPATHEGRAFVDAGGLISYGADPIALFRQAGIYAGKILKGERPADLPVQQPTTFKLVLNLKTAKTLGLTVPPSILARADEVIE